MEMGVFAISQKVTGDENYKDIIRDIGGKAGGTCYSSKPFFESLALEPEEKSKARYDMIVNTGHNIGNHTQVTIVIDGISKMMAMVLNGFKFYNTSERSGRYTNMAKDNPLYTKWKDIFIDLIGKEYPELAKTDPKRVEKLAMENARYILPIFQKSTTMVYTTGTMELNYICRWFEKFIENHKLEQYYVNMADTNIDFANSNDMRYFYSNIFSEMKEFIENVKNCGLYLEGDGHKDNKNRSMELFENRHYYENTNQFHTATEVKLMGRMYNIDQVMSFPAFADLMRHRTYNSTIIAMHNIFGPAEFYIPRILCGTDFYAKWLSDMESLDYIPQGKLITTRECGTLDKFVIKAKERLCSRVQLEVLDVTYTAIRKMAMSKDVTNVPKTGNGNMYAFNLINEIFDYETLLPKTKCQILGGCKEPCYFGSEKCFKRHI